MNPFRFISLFFFVVNGLIAIDSTARGLGWIALINGAASIANGYCFFREAPKTEEES